MSKVKSSQLSKKEKEEMASNIFKIIEKTKTKKEVFDFLIGLATSSEFLMMARRVEIAKRIDEGETYDKIKKQLKVGFGTIAKVEQWLNEGGRKYINYLDKLIVKKKSGSKKSSNYQFYESDLDKYPQYRLLKKMLGL